MAIDFKTFTSVAPIIAQARHPIMIRGGHGKGKSQVVYAMADKLEAIDGISRIVVERRASQMTEGDLLGLPDPDGRKINGERATTFCPPDWFVQACTEPCILFLDEVDRATLEVRQGIFELCDSRKIAGHVLHQDTVIFAAVNGGEHDSAAQYQVNEMDPAELDRWTVYDVEPTVEDWLTWAKDCPEISEIVYDFINNERKHLD
jgi:MoxR-like ATPase